MSALRVRKGRGELSGSSLFGLARAGVLLAVLALCLLSVDDARAEGPTEIHLEKFVPGRTTVNTPVGSGIIYEYTFNTPFTISSSFDFGGVNYTVDKVVWRGSQVDLEISPEFPPGGTNRSEFYLHLGVSGSGGVLTENAKFNFGNSTSGILNTWNGSAGWENRVQTAYLKITGPADINNRLRFASYPAAPANSGRLEIFDAAQGDDGQWKWVCDDGFGVEEAQVACRQMGLPTGGAAVWAMPSNWLTYRLGDPWSKGFVLLALSQSLALLDDVDCDGDEGRLIDCDHAGRGVNDCAVAEAVGVTCPSQ